MYGRMSCGSTSSLRRKRFSDDVSAEVSADLDKHLMLLELIVDRARNILLAGSHSSSTILQSEPQQTAWSLAGQLLGVTDE